MAHPFVVPASSEPECIMPLFYSPSGFFSTGIVIKRGLRRCGIGGMKDVQKFPRVDALPSGGLHQRGNDTMRLYSLVRSCPEAYLAEDHHVPERLFSMIIRCRYTGNAQEGKEVTLFGADKERPQGFSGFEGKRALTDGIQFLNKPLFDLCRFLPGSLA